MTKSIRTIQDLLDVGFIDKANAQKLAPVVQDYKLAISKELVALIEVKNKNGPIYRQFVPDERELEIKDYEIFDPIGDNKHSPIKGLVHRYKDRVLLKLTNNCPVYCRFCFRREMVGKPDAGILNDDELVQIANYLISHNEIHEVILTGGDPLMISPKYLLKIALILKKIPNITKLRIHTRVLSAVPKLISVKLIESLKQSEKKLRMALHINHSDELSDLAKEKISLLKRSNIELLSQTVLLKGINDDAQTLAKLYQDLVEYGVKPYYLHHPDLARGTAHFQIDFENGKSIFEELATMLSKAEMPRYVIDIPGGFGKIDVNDENVQILGNKSYQIKDRFGEFHSYPKFAI